MPDRSHDKVLKRIEGWMEHVEQHCPNEEFPLLEAVAYLMKQEAHLNYCIMEIDAIIANHMGRVQPFMQSGVPKVPPLIRHPYGTPPKASLRDPPLRHP
eukprot:8176832-Pyramimonas_sp.AAC.1